MKEQIARMYLKARELGKRLSKGKTMTEYALILAAVAIVVFITYEVMGQDIGKLVQQHRQRADHDLIVGLTESNQDGGGNFGFRRFRIQVPRREHASDADESVCNRPALAKLALRSAPASEKLRLNAFRSSQATSLLHPRPLFP